MTGQICLREYTLLLETNSQRRNCHLIVVGNAFMSYIQEVFSSKFHGFRGAAGEPIVSFFAEPPL